MFKKKKVVNGHHDHLVLSQRELTPIMITQPKSNSIKDHTI